jgi:hypothetical protein
MNVALPRPLEIELVTERGAEAPSGRAGLWLLEPTGYVMVKPSDNAFSCIVSRRGGDLFPVCSGTGASP